MIALASILLSAALLLAMIDFQTQAIFPTHAVGRAGPLPRGAERLTLPVGRGETLHGVHIPPKRRGQGPRTLVLGFAGNAWNSDDAATFLHKVYPECDIVAFHYRGYAPSTGMPSARALLADAPLVHDLAIERVKPERAIAVGLSIGTGVAAELATKRALDGIVLVTPFDSLRKVATSLYPMLPIGIMFQHEMEPAAALQKVGTPTAIIAAENDWLIPATRTDGLRKHVRNLVYDRTIAGGDHNDIYWRADFHAAMREALAAVGG